MRLCCCYREHLLIPVTTTVTDFFYNSRDTTVRVWCLLSLAELRSMGGHSSAVTCVRILPRGEELQGLESSKSSFVMSSQCHHSLVSHAVPFDVMMSL